MLKLRVKMKTPKAVRIVAAVMSVLTHVDDYWCDTTHKLLLFHLIEIT